MFLQVTIIISGQFLSCLHCWRVVEGWLLMRTEEPPLPCCATSAITRIHGSIWYVRHGWSGRGRNGGDVERWFGLVAGSEQGYTRVPHHGRCVCPTCNLAHQQWGFRDNIQHASGIGRSGRTTKSRGRHRALEEYLHTNPRYATFRRALGMRDRRVPYPSPWPCLLSSSLPSPKISLLGVCLCTPVPVPLYECRSIGMYHVCAHLSWIILARWPSFMFCIFLAKWWILSNSKFVKSVIIYMCISNAVRWDKNKISYN
jgi:hypothetical protein